MREESAGAQSMAVEVFGVVVEVTADARHLRAIHDLLPPGTRPAKGQPAKGQFELVQSEGNLMDVKYDERSLAGPVDVSVAMGILDAQMRMHIASHAPEHVFVHAGVVGVGDRAIVLPGRSFAGKTTLVAALLRAGAVYWSDEYAVLDDCGLVHPYAKPLSVRGDPPRFPEEHTAQSLGASAGDRPLAVGMIALTQYRAGASWTPRQRSAGEGAIKMLEHTVPARTRPEEALNAVRQAAAQAEVLEGERGEADETAAALISTLAARSFRSSGA